MTRAFLLGFYWLTVLYRSVDPQTIWGKGFSPNEMFFVLSDFLGIGTCTHTHTKQFSAASLAGKPTHPGLSCLHLPQEPKEIKCLGGTLRQIKHRLYLYHFILPSPRFLQVFFTSPNHVCAPLTCLSTDCFSSPPQIPSLAQNCARPSISVTDNTFQVCARQELQDCFQLNWW